VLGSAEPTGSPNSPNLHTLALGSTDLLTGISSTFEGLATQTGTITQGSSVNISLSMLLIKPFSLYQRGVYRANASDATHANAL